MSQLDVYSLCYGLICILTVMLKKKKKKSRGGCQKKSLCVCRVPK